MKREKAIIKSVSIDYIPNGNHTLFVVEYFSGKHRYYWQGNDVIPEKVFDFMYSGVLVEKTDRHAMYKYGLIC